MRRQRRRFRGFMIVQMLVVLGLMAAFVVVAERVFRLSVQTSARAALEQEDLQRLDRALTALRADVWRAGKVEVEKSSVHVSAEGLDATWKTLGDGELRRTQGKEEQRWAGLGLEFERQGPWLVVRRRGAEAALLRQAVEQVKGGVK
jgi:type II secretory pathway pseudopilin PulG